MNVFLTTLGCRLNEAEIGRWQRQLRADGHAVVAAPERADVVVLNSCAVTSDAARSSRRTLRQLRTRSPDSRLVVTGCEATIDPDSFDADLVVPNADKSDLVKLLNLGLGDDPDASAPRRTRGFVKVQDGCRHRCTYCIVTVARGSERSRSIDAVVDDVRALEDEGIVEVVLSGVHLGGYGSDIGSDLRSLIEAVVARTSVPRIRLGSLEPWDLPPGFFDLWSDPRLCPHLHLPLQSGSDTVLRRMARRCSVEHFSELAVQAREVPGFHLTTDIIVGFPGETDAEFDQTMQVIQRLAPGHAHIFRFSPRRGTAAATMSGQVHGEVKKRRSRELHALMAQLKERRLRSEIGRQHAVLWEADGTSGYTANWLRVKSQLPHERGSISTVTVDGVLNAERLSVA